jgi:hypothetical protein
MFQMMTMIDDRYTAGMMYVFASAFSIAEKVMEKLRV